MPRTPDLSARILDVEKSMSNSSVSNSENSDRYSDESQKVESPIKKMRIPYMGQKSLELKIIPVANRKSGMLSLESESSPLFQESKNVLVSKADEED